MSALPPKADMFSVKIDVCFVPLADTGASVGAPFSALQDGRVAPHV